MSQRGFAAPIILFLVLLVAVGIAFFSIKSPTSPIASPFAQPTPQPTPKTYVDAGEGFQFTYPGDLSVIPDNEKAYNDRNGGVDYGKQFVEAYGYATPTLIKGLVVKSASSSDFSLAPFILWIYDNPNDYSPARWYANYWYYPFVWGEYEPKKSTEGPDKEASVSGEIAHFTNLDYRPHDPKFIYLPHKGKMYFFKIPTPDAGQPDIGTQILNSFKFTD